MTKSTSLLAAAIVSLVMGLGFATSSNAQSRMSDQNYCHVLVDKYMNGLEPALKEYHRVEVGKLTAVAMAQCLEGNPGPAIPVLEQKLRDAAIPLPVRG
jgi:hypothetical protein